MTRNSVPPSVYVGVFLVSGLALGLEILFTRILALMLWHHFTYVVIGVALLGFGAAGSRIMVRDALSRAGTEDPTRARLARYAFQFSVATPLCYAAMTRVNIVPLAMKSDPNNIVSLLLLFVLLAVPFYLAGLFVCDTIQSYQERVGSVYFADLLGAGLGAVAAVVLIEHVTAPGAVILFAAAGALAALYLHVEPWLERSDERTGFAAGALPALAVLVGLPIWVLPYARDRGLDPPLAPSKEMAGSLTVTEVSDTYWTPLARIDVTEPLPLPPRMGGAFPPNTPVHNVRGIFQDGSAPTLLIEESAPERLAFLREASASAGHVVLAARGAEDVEQMAIGVGGGVDLLIAIQNGVKRVTGVEINRSTIGLLTEDYADFTGRLTERDDVELVHAEGRHYARASGRQFDLIQLSGVDTYTALASGAYTLSESYLYTRDAVEEFLSALTERGVLSYTRIAFKDRPRESLRLAATALEALERLGTEGPAWRNLFLLYGEQWASVIVSKQALAEPELEALRGLAARNGYDVLFDPGRPGENAYDECLRRPADERAGFYEDYPFEVRPATDDKPFFFNYFKWRGLFSTEDWGGHAYRMTYPIGHLCLVLSLLQTLVLGALCILVPLRRLERIGLGGSTLPTLAYFSALGLGFITVEIVLMQRFVLFLGHPTYSLSTVLPTVLIAAGLGSLSVKPDTDPVRRLERLRLWVPLAIVGAWLVSSFALDPLLGLPHALRILSAVILLAPLGFVLGQAFPCGVRIVADRRPELVPWVWAVNAFTTVLGSTGAVLVAMEVGFSVVMLATVPLYLGGIVLFLRGSGASTPATSA